MPSFDKCRTLFLLPLDGSTNQEQGKRYFSFDDGEGYHQRQHPKKLITGDLELIVQILKHKIRDDDTDHDIFCQVDFYEYSDTLPRMDLLLKSPSTEEIQQRRLTIHACSFQKQDLIKVLYSARIRRLRLGFVPASFYPLLSQSLSSLLKGIEWRQHADIGVLSEPMVQMVCNIMHAPLSILQYLNLSNSRIGQDYDCGDGDFSIPPMELLCTGIQSNHSLKVLNMNNCHLAEVSLSALANSLIANNKMVLEQLYLACNQIETEGAAAIARILEGNNCCRIQRLDLSLNLNVVVPSLMGALSSNSSLVKMWLGGNCLIEDCGLESLSKALSFNRQLKFLHLDGYAQSLGDPGIMSAGFEHLGKGLALAKGLTYLDLSNNNMAPSAWISIADGIRKNSSLEHLKVQCIGMKDDDDADSYHLLIIFESLMENKTLKVLDVSHNNLSSPHSLSVLGKNLTVNSTLKKLHLEDCQIDNQGATMLGAELVNWKGVRELYLKTNPSIDDSGARALLEGLDKGNIILTTLEEDASVDGTWEVIWYYLRLNRGGRQLLHSKLGVSLWPLVLQKAGRDTDVIYYLLRQEILLTT